MIKLSDYIMKRLKEVYNVPRIYMIPGGGAMHLNNSIGQYLEYICPKIPPTPSSNILRFWGT